MLIGRVLVRCGHVTIYTTDAVARCVRFLHNEPVSPLDGVRARLVRVRLLMNILSGKDAAVQSAKLLGQDREVNLFEAEARVGISPFLLALPDNRLTLPTSLNSSHARLPKRH